MKHFHLFLFLIISCLSTGCNSLDNDNSDFYDRETKVDAESINMIPTATLTKYYEGLQSINDSIEIELKPTNRIKPEDIDDLGIVVSDVKGAVYGAKLG